MYTDRGGDRGLPLCCLSFHFACLGLLPGMRGTSQSALVFKLILTGGGRVLRSMVPKGIPRRKLRSLTTVMLCLCIQEVSGQQGHTVRGNQVLVSQSTHWRAWQGASSLLEISASGSVIPVFMRKNINAALDVDSFSGAGEGGISVGSNRVEARNAIDGDPSTSWGPDPASPLSDWWLELNLGRLVVVDKIIIRFAELEEGDPFLQFKVLGWRQPPPRSTSKYELAGTDIPRFWEIGRTSRPIKFQRILEFEPRPTEGADARFSGDALDRVQIVATSSDSTRAEQITREEYEALPEWQRGETEYFRREHSGREAKISEAEYSVIDADRRGPVRFYRREIPRISEIEILTEGDNVNIGLSERGGTAFVETSGGVFKDIGPTISDGTYSTGHNGSIFGYEIYDYLEDLGALFWVDTMHFLTDGASAIDEFFVDISDGTRAPDGTISYTRVGESSRWSTEGHTSPGGIRFREIRIEPSKVRYLRTPFQNPLSSLSYIGITEVMLYGEGYVPEVILTSDLVQLGATKNLISLEWEADLPEGTTVGLQTRTGNELEEISEYFDSKGNPVSESKYNRLPGSKKGDIKSRLEPGGDWSSWSVPYTRPGAEIISPSPRQYLQMRVTLLTDRQDVAATLYSITLNMSDPVADRLVGEIFPLQVDRIGEAGEFSYFVRPVFSNSSQGFDELKIEATAGASMGLTGIRWGTDEEFDTGTAGAYSAAEIKQLSSAQDTLHLAFPERLRRGVDLVEVQLRAAILGNSASFRSFARDSRDGLWQRVDEGDATALVGSQKMTVVALQGSGVIQNLSLGAGVLTPNGDGFNEELIVSFSVARLSSDQAVKMSIYDLSGRLVHRVVEEREDARGQYEILWDGSAGSGNMVSPGIYLLSLEVEADSRSASNTLEHRLVQVAY